jgi:hypothetical protein
LSNVSLIELLYKLSRQELKEILPRLTPEERAELDRPLTAGLPATDLEAFTDQAWPLIERYLLAKGPWYRTPRSTHSGDRSPTAS